MALTYLKDWGHSAESSGYLGYEVGPRKRKSFRGLKELQAGRELARAEMRHAALQRHSLAAMLVAGIVVLVLAFGVVVLLQMSFAARPGSNVIPSRLSKQLWKCNGTYYTHPPVDLDQCSLVK